MKFKIILKKQTPEAREIPSTLVMSFIGDNKELLLKFMKFARSKSKVAAGLASNQVACDNIRITDRFCAIKHNHQWTLAINPVLTELQGEPILCEEGCLTWPGKTFKVWRHQVIKVSYFDLDGWNIETVAEGFHAQIWQHEIDHLNGVHEAIDPM